MLSYTGAKKLVDSAYSDNQSRSHSLYSKLASKINVSEQITLDSLSATQIPQIRKFNSMTTT